MLLLLSTPLALGIVVLCFDVLEEVWFMVSELSPYCSLPEMRAEATTLLTSGTEHLEQGYC